VSLTSLLLIAGGSVYYFVSFTNAKEESHNLKKHHKHIKHNQLLENEIHMCNHGHFINEIDIEEPVRPIDIPIESSLAHEMMLINNHKQGNW
jgi:leishmanolysin